MEPDNNSDDNRDKLVIPGAIIVAGVIIAGAIVLSGGGFSFGSGSAPKGGGEQVAEEVAKPRPVTAEDHIRGSIDADIFIIEYSDIECPFCKLFHSTMQQVMDEYGEEGQVAWVYRHFPIPQLHKKAQTEAEATECVAELGGNDAFWSYIDRIFEVTPSNDGLDLALLPQFAEDIGIDRKAFEECLESGRHEEKVQKDRDEAIATGGLGTPHSLVIVGDIIIPIAGAQPFEAVKDIIEQALDLI